MNIAIRTTNFISSINLSKVRVVSFSGCTLLLFLFKNVYTYVFKSKEVYDTI